MDKHPATKIVTEASAYEALRAAQLHEHQAAMASSAKLTAQDAEKLFNKGDYVLAHKAALRSLFYSVGKLSPVYARIAALGV